MRLAFAANLVALVAEDRRPDMASEEADEERVKRLHHAETCLDGESVALSQVTKLATATQTTNVTATQA